jgi:hypothetical protein
MKFSNDTEEVLKFLDFSSGNNLRKRNDLGNILELGAFSGDSGLVNLIIFSGKSIWNLPSTLKMSKLNGDETQYIKNELTNSILELKSHLTQLLINADQTTKDRFNDIYLSPTEGSSKNLIDLSHDLSEFKKLQTTMKQKNK